MVVGVRKSEDKVRAAAASTKTTEKVSTVGTTEVSAGDQYVVVRNMAGETQKLDLSWIVEKRKEQAPKKAAKKALAKNEQVVKADIKSLGDGIDVPTVLHALWSLEENNVLNTPPPPLLQIRLFRGDLDCEEIAEGSAGDGDAKFPPPPFLSYFDSSINL